AAGQLVVHDLTLVGELARGVARPYLRGHVDAEEDDTANGPVGAEHRLHQRGDVAGLRVLRPAALPACRDLVGAARLAGGERAVEQLHDAGLIDIGEGLPERATDELVLPGGAA